MSNYNTYFETLISYSVSNTFYSVQAQEFRQTQKLTSEQLSVIQTDNELNKA